MSYISSPLNIGSISIIDKGIASNTSYVSTASFITVSSSIENIYAFDKLTSTVTAYASSSRQTQSILWINDGTGGDGTLRWDLLDTVYPTLIEEYGYGFRYQLKTKPEGGYLHDGIPYPASDNTYGTDYALIFDIYPYSNDPSLYLQYDQYTYKTSDTGSIIINGFYTSSVSASYLEAVIFTVSGSGSYAFQAFGFKQTGATCSLYIKESGRYLFPGISDYKTGGWADGQKFFNGHLLFVSSSVFATTESKLIKPPISSSVYFNSTGSFFEVLGNQTSYFKAGATVQVAGYSLLVNGSSYETTSGIYLSNPAGGVPTLGPRTRVYTMTYPFTGSMYAPFTASTGINSYALGHGVVADYGPKLAIGTFNKTGNNDSLFVIGNGIDNTNRSDIFSVSRNRVSVTGSLNILGSISGSITGSLLGTASWATQSISSSVVAVSSTNTNGTYYLHFGNQTSGHDNIEVDTNLTYNPSTNQLTTTGITGSLFGTSSWAQSSSISISSSYSLSSSYALNATSSSFSSTASYVNTLNQNVLITGSLTVGASSLGANENTLVLGPSPAGGTGEGGQILLQAPGGTYTSASMWDNYQNQTRLLRGTNAGSDAIVASFNMHTKQVQFPTYTNVNSFPGTAAAFLAVDTSGNIITTSSAGGGGSSTTINNNVDNYIITGTGTLNTLNGESNLQFNGSSLTVTGQITASGAIISQVNGAMYFRGGDDAEFWDINVANTVGIYGQQNADRAGIKLGSSGPTLFGSASRVGIGTITPTLGTLEVNGNVYANSFTGSLFGTSSWAQSSSQALTASYVNPLNQTVIISGSIILSSSAPPAVAGGIYFDGTDFYLGF